MHRRTRSILAATVLLVLLVAVAGCSSSDSSGSSKSASTDASIIDAASADSATTGGSAPATGSGGDTLDILVSNDDGYAADGIDNLVTNLQKLPKVKLTVVAPLTNQSGQGGKTTPGPLKHTDVVTKSGHPAVAVEGYPADAVNVAFDELGVKPDLVVAGDNIGQNLGPVIDVSGTVGAARAGAARGVPAVAASTGLGQPVDFQSTSDAVVAWIKAHRSELGTKDAKVTVVNINGPSCGTTGKVRGTKDVPPAGGEVKGNGDPPNCASTLTDPTNDVEAFNNGFVVVDTIPLEPGG